METEGAETDPKYWDQWPGETSEEFQWFQYFRELGTARRMRTVSLVSGISAATLARWAESWIWRERCAVFDRAMLQDREAVLTKLRNEQHEHWAEEQAEIFALHTQIVRQELAALVARQAAGERMRPNEIARHVEVLNRARTVAAGGVTDRVDTGSDLSHLTDEEFAQYERLRALITKGPP